MAKWSQICVGFDISDETVNFGTRAVAVTNDSLFESVTVASLQTDEEVVHKPKGSAIYSEKLGITVAVDKSITLFDIGFTMSLLSAHFESEIECIETSSNGDFVFCGLKNSKFLCLCAPKNGKMIFSKLLLENEIYGTRKTFSRIISRCTDEHFEVYAFLNNGMIIRAKQENTSGYILNSMQQNYADTLEDNIVISEIESLKPRSQFIAVTQFSLYGDEGVLVTASNMLSFLNPDVGELEVLYEGNNFKVKKMDFISSNNILVCLDEDGYLFLMCCHTFQVIKKWKDEKVKSFTTIINDEFRESFNILIITDSEVPELCSVELPAFIISLRLKVAQHSYLIDKQHFVEDIIYLEGFGSQSINTIRIKAVMESCPEFRLNRLLQRGKFAEAETFAQSFNISRENVYKARAKWYMEKISLNKNPECYSTYFNDLLLLLRKIEDVEFVAECCLKVMVPDLKMIQQVFNYALERLAECAVKNDSVLKLIDDVISANITLETYVQINDDRSFPENWLIFYNSNPIVICKNYLLRGELQKAVIVCRRHSAKIKSGLPRSVAIEMFQNIPLCVPIDLMAQWLRAYIPIFLNIHLDLLPIFVVWLENYIKELELQYKTNFLEKGLYIIEEVLDTFKTILSKDPCLEMSPPFPDDECETVNSPISCLYSLAFHIQQLFTLKKEYKVEIDFEEYLYRLNRESGHEYIINLILDQVNNDKIPSLMTGFLKNYCSNKYLDMDSILSSYIARMVQLSSNGFFIETGWESRAICFIKFIKNVQYKMKAIKITIANACVPWTEEVKVMAEEAMKVDHFLTEDIYHHIKRIPMKIIIKKYGLPINTNVTDMYCLVRFIFKQNLESAFEDAKEVVKSGTPEDRLLPNFEYMLQGIESGNTEMCLHLLKTELDEDQITQVLHKTITNLISLLQNRYVIAEDNALDAIPTLYSTYLALSPSDAKILEEEIHILNSFKTLKKKYGLMVPSNVLRKPVSVRKRHLKEHLEKLCVTDDVKLSKLAESVGEIAILFKLPREIGWLNLSSFYAYNNNSSLSSYFLRFVVDAENSLFKNYSGDILEILTILLKLVTSEQSTDIEHRDSVLSIIDEILKKAYLFCNKYHAVEVGRLRSLVKLFLQVKQNDSGYTSKQFYSEQIEAPSLYPPLTFCNMIISKDEQPLVNKMVEEENEEDTVDVENRLVKLKAANREQFIKLQTDVEIMMQALPHNLTSIHKIQTIIWSLLQRGKLNNEKKLMMIVKEKVLNVLGRVLSHNRPLDLELALALLNLLPSESALHWLFDITGSQGENRNSLRNASAAAVVGMHYSKFLNIEDSEKNQIKFFKQYLKFQCYIKLQRLGIAPKITATYSETYEGKRALLQKLMLISGVDLNFLHSFCRDLNFSFQECLRIYLEHTLFSWKPKYEEFINPKTGKSELLMHSKIEDLLHECLRIEEETVDKHALVEYLRKGIFNKVNFYHYEVFMVIIDLILKLSPEFQETLRKHKVLLSFLISYQRISPVSCEESENWFHTFPEVSSLPHISKYRLPFFSLPAEPFKIIRPELSLKTYKLWLSAPDWLDKVLNKDHICISTIMNMKKDMSLFTGWNLHLQNKQLMTEIEECISNIKSMESAVAALYCVVNYIMPPGADRVEAAKICYIKAQAWALRDQSESARIGLSKAQNKYFMVATYHILYKYRIARSEYLSLVQQPANLITTLYHDPSITSKVKDLGSPQPAINKAVFRISQLHAINLTSILKELLVEWLHTNNSLNSSCDEYFASVSATVSDNITRACYVLSGFKGRPELENFVLNMAFSQESMKSSGVQLRALQCLRATNNNSDLERLTGRDLVSLRELMLNLEFCSELSKFALDYDANLFDTSNKEEIVQILLKRSCTEALVLCAKMSVTYEITTPTIWNSLLSNMTSLNLANILEYCLPEISHIAHLLDKRIFISAWHRLIFTLLSNEKPGKASIKAIEKVFNLIQTCPFLTSLELDEIISIFNGLNCPHFADLLSSLKG